VSLRFDFQICCARIRPGRASGFGEMSTDQWSRLSASFKVTVITSLFPVDVDAAGELQAEARREVAALLRVTQIVRGRKRPVAATSPD
jgi:hypothetical protein